MYINCGIALVEFFSLLNHFFVFVFEHTSDRSVLVRHFLKVRQTCETRVGVPKTSWDTYLVDLGETSPGTEARRIRLSGSVRGAGTKKKVGLHVHKSVLRLKMDTRMYPTGTFFRCFPTNLFCEVTV